VVCNDNIKQKGKYAFITVKICTNQKVKEKILFGIISKVEILGIIAQQTPSVLLVNLRLMKIHG
jgi:hypothetical protein